MSHFQELRKRIDELRETIESEHFSIRFNLRNPKREKAWGPAGVRDLGLIWCYLDGLERLYRILENPPYSRRPPQPDGGKTRVHVFDSSIPPMRGDPFTYTPIPKNSPEILLPCWTNEPTIEGERLKARMDAVHEATHLFNDRERPLNQKMSSELWGWLDEGTAVHMEGVAYPGNPDTLRFYGAWNNQPEMSLDRKGFEYQSAAFVGYLSATHGPEFLSRMWMTAGPDEVPLDVIARLLETDSTLPTKFSSSDPHETDVFFSRFCRDSYFPETFESPAFAPDLYHRHGSRALTESFELPMASAALSYSLDHLACRYFTLYPSRNSANVVVKVHILQDRSPSFIKASVTLVDSRLRPIEHRWLVPEARGATSLASSPLSLSSPHVDHLLVCVSNCAYDSPVHNVNPRTADNVEFTLSAECY